jgi:hypothetical protein
MVPANWVIFVVMAPTSGLAQTQPAHDDRERTIPLSTIQLPTGFMREAVNPESLRFAALPAMRQQQPEKRGWARRHPVLFGALLGAGIGVGVELAVIPGSSGGEPHSAYLPMFAGMGAGIGSLVGLIVSTARR